MTMTSLLLLLALALALPPRLQPQPAALHFTFVGNAAVMVTDGVQTLLSDFPYESGAFGYMTYDRAGVRPIGAVTVLVTHGHRDHFVPALLEGTAWRVIAPPGMAPAVPADRAATLEGLAAAGIRVTPITTSHAQIPHQSYRVVWHGRTLHFTGDTEDVSALLAERVLDVAFVTPWLYKAATARGAAIDARHVVIYHHMTGETVPGCTGRCRVPAQGETWR